MGACGIPQMGRFGCRQAPRQRQLTIRHRPESVTKRMGEIADVRTNPSTETSCETSRYGRRRLPISSNRMTRVTTGCCPELAFVREQVEPVELGLRKRDVKRGRVGGELSG